VELTHRRRVDAAAPLLAPLSAVLTGLLAGGMVFIDIVLLPFWRSTAPAEFRRWFTAHSDRIRRMMVPLGASAGAVSTAYALTRASAPRTGGAAATVAAAANLGVIAITISVNEPANHRFTGALTDGETRTLLNTWARWHHVRVVLGVTATAAAAVASLEQPSPAARRCAAGW
jgi:hypothetical protein